MVMINRASKEITLKIVYYGPGLCGKTTNLEFIYAKSNPEKRGKLLTVATETDRTLFFDFLPMELGTILGMKLRVQLYTVPGQVFYDATRRIVLRGSDGIVFVADSQLPMLDANWESVENMKKNLMLNSIDPDAVPLVFQYNKQDLPNLATVEAMEEALNWRKAPHFGAVATVGTGVNETVRKIIELVIRRLHDQESSLRHPPRTTEVPPSPPLPEPVAPPAQEEPPPAVVQSAEDTTEEELGVEVETEFDVAPPAPQDEASAVPLAPEPALRAEKGGLPVLDASSEEVPAAAPIPEPEELPMLEAPPAETPAPVEEMVEIEAEIEPEVPTAGIQTEPEPLPQAALEVVEPEVLPPSAAPIEELPGDSLVEEVVEVEVQGGLEEISELGGTPEGTAPPFAGPAPEPALHATMAQDVEVFRRVLDDMLHRLRGFVSELEDLKARLAEFEERLKRE